MSAPVDVLAVMGGYCDLNTEMREARAAVAELVEAARLAEFHFRQWSEAKHAGEKAHSLKYLKGEMENLRAALARVRGGAA